MRRSLAALSHGLHQLALWGATACLLVMLATVALQVVARYGFNAPPVWTEEVARYMMVWAGLLGATVSFHQKADAVLLESLWPRRWQALGAGIRAVAVLGFLLPVLYFCFFSWRGVWGQGYIGRAMRLSADTLGISMAWIAAAVPLSAFIIVVHLVARACARPEGEEPA